MNTAGLTDHGLSVFMPNYNHAAFLPTALDALLVQTLAPDRIYIVDDASTDQSRAIIEDYANRHPGVIVPIFLEKNRGCISNIRQWLANDRSEFIFFAAADDAIFPTLLEKSVALLQKFPSAGVCSAYSRHMDKNGKDLGRFPSWGPLQKSGYISPEQADRFLTTYDSWFMGTTTVYRGSILRSIGFDNLLDGFADGLTCRVISLRNGACFIPLELASWRIMGTGIAAQDLANPAIVHRTVERVNFLMRNTYKGLFSEQHIKRWTNRWLFWAVAAAYHRSAKEQAKILNELLRPFSIYKRITLRIISHAIAPYFQRCARLLAFLLLRPFDIVPALKRRLFVNLN
jgi:glycosyltransferase involved in cell wall biosynthesis